MKVLAVTLFALLAVASAKNINIEEVIDLEDNTAYNYHAKIGIPLADEIRKAEAAGQGSRIAGGSAAVLGQFPYMAGLLIDLNGGGQSVCGGAIITPWRVLTAAHCWFDGRHQAWRVTSVAGAITLFTLGTRLQSTQVEMHVNWNPNLITNDIAMIYLPTGYTLSNNIRAAILPTGDQMVESFVGEIATAVGFGRTGDVWSDSITTAQRLSHVNLPIITNTQCAISFPHNVATSNICTSGANGRSTCRGDDGGPLVVTRNHIHVLVGINSFGSARGCKLGYPAVFVRTTSYLPWIESRM